MLEHAARFVNVLPAEKNEVLLKDRIDVSLRKLLADWPAVFVPDQALRLVVNLPSTLPGEIAEVGVLQVERSEKFIKPAEFEKLAPVEGA